MRLDKEESELLKSIEKNEWRSIEKLDEEIERSRAIARASVAKEERMNIRVNRRDIMALKVHALERGLPYQTLVSSILHQWLRRESVATKKSFRIASLFAESELRELAPMLKKYLTRRVRKGALTTRTAAGVFVPRLPPGDRLLAEISSGDMTRLSELEVTDRDAAELFDRLFALQGRPDLTEAERDILDTALTRLQVLVAPQDG